MCTCANQESQRLIHVAGNSVLDLPVRNVPLSMGPAADGWARGNVHFLDRPVEGVLGGSGGATAYLLGRLGVRVSLNTQVGGDVLGGVLRTWFDRANVDLLAPPAAHTAVNVISLSPEGARRSFYYTGEKVDWRRSLEVSEAGWFFASGYGQVDGGDLRVLIEVFGILQERGICVAFDPSPWFFKRASRADMFRAWERVDCLLGTEAELATWESGLDVEALIERLLGYGPRWVAVKQGAKGAAFGDLEGAIGRVPAERIERAYTVGAGDTFNASVLDGLCRGLTLETAVQHGVRLATQAVRQGGGVLGALGDDGG